MPKWLGGASLQLLAACLLSTLLGFPKPAKYKVTEIVTYLATYYALTSETILRLVELVIILVECMRCFHG